jgi:hypothetical protein
LVRRSRRDPPRHLLRDQALRQIPGDRVRVIGRWQSIGTSSRAMPSTVAIPEDLAAPHGQRYALTAIEMRDQS